jgi:hypothetical protein
MIETEFRSLFVGQMIQNCILPVFRFLEQNFVYFLSRTMAKQNLDSFFVSQKDFESNVAFFLFRKNRQNSDKTAVCFVCLLLGEILFCSE